MIIHQKQAEKMWVDESGNSIPVERLTALEKLTEKTSARVLKKAESLAAKLEEFKVEVSELSEAIYLQSLLETNTEGKKRKGNFTYFNFNRTIKIEVSISERIEFDDLKIQACQEKLNEFIDRGTTNVDDFLRGIIMDAFSKSNGSLDAKKVIGLKRHRERTSDPIYHEAMDLLDAAIRKPESKKYFRVFVMDEQGKYNQINLNFSSI
jgi:hypothetical protein